LAESEDPAAGRRRFRLYVIEVEALDPSLPIFGSEARVGDI